MIEQMQAVNTSAITPMSHAQDVTQRLRDDVVTEPDQHSLFQTIAPQVEAGLYLVPKVIERTRNQTIVRARRSPIFHDLNASP